MEVTSIGDNSITACPNCDDVISVKGAYNLGGLQKAIESHLAANPKCQKYQDDLPSMHDVVAALHDHECISVPCECICGCKEETGCSVITGKLCTSCHISYVRNDDEHGLSM